MSRSICWRLCLSPLALLLSTSLTPTSWAASEKSSALEKDVGQGALRIVQEDGGVVECPLKHTDVKAEVSGFIARVRVTQTFHNPTKEKIEAVYVFPLPHEAAVDEMTMVLGDRKIVGLIKRRQEARAIYEQAVAAGQTAALLEQERPNIFTQTVGNIGPEQEVKIEISYVDVLRYDMGTYEFHFPMVVGPRYIPGTPSGGSEPRPAGQEGKVSPPVANTDRVPDAQRISPPVLKPGNRTGHDISLAVSLDAGVPIQDLKSANHQTELKRDGESKAQITLAKGDSLPNKDFVLRYAVVGQKPAMAVLGHTGNYTDTRRLGSGYFMLMIQPAEDERLTKSPPREIVFLVDVSGSMSGEPTAKVIDAMQSMLKLCRPADTVQVITFASQAQKLFEKPVPVVAENVQRALNFTAGLQGRGGTEMLKGVKLAIDEPIDRERLRIVVMLTDGYIGNEAEIIEHVGKHCGDQVRFWCIGIGASPNMFLVDGVARQGGGMGKKLGLKDETEPLTQEIMTRIQRAQLAKIKIDWGDLKVSETYPAKIPELWAGRPVILYGRYSGGGRIAGNVWQVEIKVSGSVEGEAVDWPLTVKLPAQDPQHDVLAKTWARQKIEDLMQQTFYQGSPAVEETVTAIALDYRLMSQYTSFVAVDAQEAKEQTEPARPPRRMLVPVPLPEGTRWEGFFGDGDSGVADGLAVLGLRVERESVKEAKRVQYGFLFQQDRLADSPGRSKRQTLSRSRGFSLRPESLMQFGSSPRGAQPARPMADGDRFYFQKDTRGLGRGGFGGSIGSGPALNMPRLAEALHPSDKGETERRYAVHALSAEGGATLKAAQDAQQSVQALLEQKKSDDQAALRQALLRAYFLDMAAANAGQSDGSIAAQALAQLESLHEKQVRQAAKELPQLDKKLDLVLRDKSVEEALAAVGQAAGVKITLLAGSVQDATALLEESPHVTYLDLRRATVAQALDWILQPARMSWSPAKDGITAGTDRRRDGVSAWVYDVADIALPLSEELEKLGDPQKAMAESQKAAEEFLSVARKEVQADEKSVVWYAPGELLVFGNSQAHAKAASVLTSLRGPGAKREGSLADKAFKRVTARKEQLAKAGQAREQLAAAMTHDRFGWQLLAGAAAGRLDDEALTELSISWRSPATAELLKGEGATLVLRSLWIVREAARSLPKERGLSALAEVALAQSQDARQRVLKSLQANQGDELARLSVLYAALASPEDADYRTKALARFAATDALARGLLAEPQTSNRQSLIGLVSDGMTGADRVALTALACRRAGGEAWDTFRAQSPGILGSQALPGEVVVLVNELSQPQLLLAKQP